MRRVGLALLLIAIAPSAFAAGDADTWLGVPRWIFLAINLAVFLGVIAKFGVPKILAALDARSAATAAALALAEKQQAEVADLERRLEAGLAEIESQIRALTEKAEQDAARERAEILASAEVEKERVFAQARAEAENRIDQARSELTRHAASLAAELAAAKLAQQLDDATRAELMRSGIAEVERARS